MREAFTHVVSEKQRYQCRAYKAEQQLKDANIDAMKHDNDRLKQLLHVNGIAFDRLVSVANASHLPTRSDSRPSVEGQHSPLSSRQASVGNQQPPVPARQRSFPSQQSSIVNPLADVHPALRQQPGTTLSSSSPGLHRILSNETTAASPVSLTTSHNPSAGGVNDFNNAASMTGSTYASSLPSPISNICQQPQPYLASTCTNHTHNHDTFNTGVSEASTFRPPLGQGLVDGRVVRNNSDERILQRDMNHDQLGVEFVLA